VGFGDMKSTSVSQTLEQLLNCILTIVMIYAVAGSSDAPTMAAAGNLVGTISIILAFIYIVLYYQKHKVKVRRYDKSVEDNKSTKEIIKTILALSIPITIGSLISVLNTFIDTTTVSNGIQDAFKNYILDKGQLEQKAMEMKGILSKVNTIVGLPQAVNIAIGTALVPSISGFLAKKEFEQAKKMMKKSMNISLFIVMPSVVGLFVLSEPLLKVMYPHAYQGSELMMLLCIPTLFICLNHTVNRWITRGWRCNNSINCSICRSSNKDSYEFSINKDTKYNSIEKILITINTGIINLINLFLISSFIIQYNKYIDAIVLIIAIIKETVYILKGVPKFNNLHAPKKQAEINLPDFKNHNIYCLVGCINTT